MQALRQLGSGVIIAIFSVILVVGGIFLSLAETLPPAATPTQIPPTFPESFPTPTATLALIETLTETASPSPTASPTVLSSDTAALFPTVISLPSVSVSASCTTPNGWVRIITSAGDTIYSLAQRYKTSAEGLSTANCLTSIDLPAGSGLYVPPVPTVTIAPCGPPFAWVKNHIVQPGDTLYRIALSYGITFPQLQRGNCMGSSTTIYTGQRLWVPNIISTRTSIPVVTFVPDFPTETPIPVINTPTEPPTETSTPPATNTPIPEAPSQ